MVVVEQGSLPRKQQRDIHPIKRPINRIFDQRMKLAKGKRGPSWYVIGFDLYGNESISTGKTLNFPLFLKD
jgi:hypothetical protein